MPTAPLMPYDDRDGYIWIDGVMKPWREAKIHVMSHGLHYGGSVFEGERVYDGNIFKLKEHSDRLVKSGALDLTRLVQLLTVGPARALGLPGGSLEKGRPADITIFDPAEVRTVKPESFRGKSRNSPFVSMTLTGWPVATLVEGRVVFRAK